MLFSIVIPAYESKGESIRLLTDLFNSLKEQTYTNFEVVVADHSTNNDIKNLCNTYDFNLHHFFNSRGRGNASVNMNEGIKRSNGEVIKIMHMDDIFCNPDALKLIRESLQRSPEKSWGAVSFNHNYENEGKSVIRREITPSVFGVIGCPSVSFFRNNRQDPDLFDENLVIINDHDLHQRLFRKYGDPIIINDISVTIRMHESQVSSWIGSEKELREIEYFKSKNLDKC